MGRIVPDGAAARVSFFEVHAPVWAERAAEIGASPASIAAVRAKVEAARALLDARELAIGRARAATRAFNDAVAELSVAGAEVIRQVKVRAAAGGGAAMTLALLPRPARPAPLAPPGTPTNFAVALRAGGSLVLSWACRNPAGAGGTVYQVARQLGGAAGGGGSSGDGPFTVIGTGGAKRFVDATLPAGAACVTYQVTAIRSTATGTPARFTVRFGVAGAGAAAGGAAAAAAARVAA